MVKNWCNVSSMEGVTVYGYRPQNSILRALCGFLYVYVDKSVRAWYEDGLMIFYTSN